MVLLRAAWSASQKPVAEHAVTMSNTPNLLLALLLSAAVALSAALPESPAQAETRPRAAAGSKAKPKRNTRRGAKLPRGVDVLWDKTWTMDDCRWKDRTRCIVPSRYRRATRKEQKDGSWNKARGAARHFKGRGKRLRNTFVPFAADGVRYLAYLATDEDQDAIKANKLDEVIPGVVLLIRKVQPKPTPIAKPGAELRALPYDGAKKPRGVRLYWKWAWKLKECEDKKRPQCVPPTRYRSVTPEDKRDPSWKLAVQTARFLLSGEPAYGSFVPFIAGGVRYVAYISPHTATDIDTNGDGRLERVPLDEPVRGVSVYIRRVQPNRR